MAPQEGGDSQNSAGSEAAFYDNTGSNEGSAPAVEPEPAPSRDYQSEARDTSSSSSQSHLPLAHFEPAPRVEPSGGGESKQPYVVWSSAPAADKGPANQDHE
jgi:hypothetical protein